MLQRLIDFGSGNVRVRQLHLNVLVIRQFEFRCCDYRCAEAHRFVLAELDVFDVSQGSHAQLLLFDCFMITFRNDFFGQLILDFLAESFVYHGTRSLPRPITWNLGKSRKAVCNRIPLLCHFLRRQFNLQLRDEPRLLFHFNLHYETTLRCAVL